MKKTMIFLLLGLLYVPLNQSFAQEYEYIPFPDSNCIWSEKYTPPIYYDQPSTYYIYALFDDDTVMNSIQYHKLYILYDSVIVKSNATYIGAIREDSTKKIYYRGEHLFFGIDSELLNENNELLLYDFSVSVGDTVHYTKFGAPGGFLIVSEIDTVELNSGRRRIIYFQYHHFASWIEGIGNDKGLLSPGTFPTNGTYNELICFSQNDTIIYLNSNFSGCFNSLSSIADNQNVDNFGVYPNPVVGTSYLELVQLFDILEIYKSDGAKILSKDITGLEHYDINSILFDPGLYLYRIFSDKGFSKSGRFIVY